MTCRNGHVRHYRNIRVRKDGALGCRECEWERKNPPEKMRIDNAALREAVLNSELSITEIARRLGYIRTASASAMRTTRARGGRRHDVDITKLQRQLGIKPCKTYRRGKVYVSHYTTIRYDIAERICRVIGALPYEVGV